jgi:hypothetical protein
VPALQIWSPEFKSQYHQKKKPNLMSQIPKEKLHPTEECMREKK